MLKTKNGFTIVELLIVIVVIGILALVTIVAYNGIQDRARASSATSALTQAAKKLAIYQVDNSAYPTSLSAVGIANSSDVSYQYLNTSNGYCLTAKNGVISYRVTQTGAPEAGACTMTNYVTNPSFETNLTGWSLFVGSTIAQVSGGSGIVAGTNALEVVATASNQSGVRYVLNGLSPNIPYTFSVYFTPLSGDPTGLGINVGDGAGTRANAFFTPVATLGETIRKSVSWTSSAGPGTTQIAIFRTSPVSSGVTFRVDAVMLEQGPNTSTYADGSSAGWSWSGTAHASASNGPPL